MRVVLLIGILFFFISPAFAACTNPDGAEGEMIYNSSHDVYQGCTSQGWRAFHAPSTGPISMEPEGCPNIGNVCTGDNAGIIYAGEYAGHKLYVAGADAPSQYGWNNGQSGQRPNLNNEFMPDCPRRSSPRNGNRYTEQANTACTGAKGPAFTAYLATFGGSGSPYRAASYCYHLGKSSDPAGANNPLAHGHDNWYLPAVDELEFIYDNLGPEPKHGFKGEYYWSSTELNGDNAWSQSLANGYQNTFSKVSGVRVRCVRR